MATAHVHAADHEMAAMDTLSGETEHCCETGTDGMQSCHLMIAVVPTLTPNAVIPRTGRAITFGSGLVLSGVEPSGPLDPPRAA